MSIPDTQIRALILSLALLAYPGIAGLTCVGQERDTNPAPPNNANLLFAFRVDPLLKARCHACHGTDAKKIEGELDLTSSRGLLRGGASGVPGVVAGKPHQSPLYLAVTRNHQDWSAMPPKENDRLNEKEIRVLRDWIAAGAPWPNNDRLAVLRRQQNPWATAEGVQVVTSGGLSETWTNRLYVKENLWAYQPLGHSKPPEASGDPINAFVQARLPAGIRSAREADRRTLIRRLTYDLTGLPPTPAEIEQFLADNRTDAYRHLVERLLDSPRYGEQWGRHWLDVVRYADSAGFANDFERPHAWRYRDYVIRALNEDKPYDEFIRQQLAGDEKQNPTVEDRIAVGFLRMGPWEQTGMAVARVTRQQFLDDVTASVGQVFLGHALQCARCHDHKFDPVPTRDYYALQAVFATTQFADVDAAFEEGENRSGFEEHRKYHMMRVASNKKRLEQIAQPRKTPNDFGRERLGRKWSLLLDWGADRYKPIAMSVYSGTTHLPRNATRRRLPPKDPTAGGQLEATAILTGGDLFTPADAVQPAVLSATGLATSIPSEIRGRRTALADWITSKHNPLTARVMVNRIWQYHFGRGLAGNPNNLGATGKKPTHPELLDWLAREFIDSGWSIKMMHRRICNSAVYRRTSTHPDSARLKELDPSGSSYAVFHPRRLSAEELRDSMLAVSGELIFKAGGLPARPDINLEAALQPRMIMGTFAPSYVPDPLPDQRNRRTVYALKLRGARDPFMTTFNQPSPDESCEQRDSSNVTPQVLTLLNSQESADRALAFAIRLIEETGSDREAIDRAFQLAFGRKPRGSEVRVALAHWREAEAEQETIEPQPQQFPSEITRHANEENTGEPFSYTEQLFEYRDYVPDVESHQVDMHTRALADLCLVLINANEFIYIY